ncbi:hypothetical protein [Verrucomicrobium sp. BvORR106]|uniref:hypothetical protein n=1 Tax=Verrucomicrobium sp. BvORR106 TaxID=1403819 RepID=UPI000570E5A9|nr:hypothetical protein [Verrucomicrobium sp. BvORR106]
MSEVLEDFKQYLPTYLSGTAKDNLFKELESFPKNIDERIYTRKLQGEAVVFQGDGIKEMPFINLPNEKVGPANVLVISNTCDIDPTNQREIPLQVSYCPIVKLGSWLSRLREPAPLDQAVRAQRVSSMFYLPKNEHLKDDSVALLDRMVSCSPKTLPFENLREKKLFTLSDYGFYLFLFKLSIHMTRIREGVART